MFEWSLLSLTDEIALSLLFYRLISQAKAFSVFLYTGGALRASASLWRFIGLSSMSVFLLWWGAQNCTQYSKCCLLGLLKELACFGLPFSHLRFGNSLQIWEGLHFFANFFIRPNSDFPSFIWKLSSMCPDSHVSKLCLSHNSEIKGWLGKKSWILLIVRF